MSPTVAIGLVLALGSSAAINWGYLAQHGAASSLPPLTLRHPVRSLVSLFSNLRWFAGFMAGIGGWVVYVVALALAPLSLVQAAAAGGIGLLALLVHRARARGYDGASGGQCGSRSWAFCCWRFHSPEAARRGGSPR